MVEDEGLEGILDIPEKKGKKGVFISEEVRKSIETLFTDTDEELTENLELFFGDSEEAVEKGYCYELDIVYLGPKEGNIRYTAFLDLDMMEYINTTLTNPVIDNVCILMEKDFIGFTEKFSLEHDVERYSVSGSETDGMKTLTVFCHLKEHEEDAGEEQLSIGDVIETTENLD